MKREMNRARLEILSWGAAALLLLPMALLIATPARAQTDAEKLYKAKCVACHGADGSGKTTAGEKAGVRDFHSAEVQSQKDADLIDITSKGKNKMPGFGKSLKPDEIKSLVAYVRELGKKK